MSIKTNVPRLKGLVVGEYGKILTLTLKDFDGVAQDVSAYTGITVISRSPDSKKTLSSTGSFATDGSDGIINWSFDSDNYADRPGIWDGQVWLTKTGVLSKSYPVELEVERSLN